jgi:peptide-methionine (S)-S-oxide reductase
MPNNKKIYLGGGCFWCTEASFRIMDGVIGVVNGYAGGEKQNPTYEEVSDGSTGHAEVSEITYDEEKISLEKILTVFFKMHDPTSVNRQGNDVGPQYRSVILWTDSEQEKIIAKFVAAAQTEYAKPIATEVEQLERFWPAEEYHQRYFEKNPDAAYCRLVIAPKIKKLKEEFLT